MSSGAPGRKILGQVLPRLIPRWGLGLVVCNAENAAGGSGLTLRCYEELIDAGVDVLTMGDHVYRKDEIFQIFEKTGDVLRPANFPEDSPGSDLSIVTARDGTPVAVFSVLGRTFMRPVDCPFRAADRILDRIGGRTRVIIVDVHAEATSDKQLLGRYLDGRVSAVLGTHTHVATADEQILKNGTAYQTDVGMTGPHDSIIGRRYDRVLSATLTFVQNYFDVATGDPRLNGALLTDRSPDRPRPDDQPGQHRPERRPNGCSPNPCGRGSARAVRDIVTASRWSHPARKATPTDLSCIDSRHKRLRCFRNPTVTRGILHFRHELRACRLLRGRLLRTFYVARMKSVALEGTYSAFSVFARIQLCLEWLMLPRFWQA